MNPWALDSETFLIFPGYLAPEMVCVTWAHNNGTERMRAGLIHGRDPRVGLFIQDRLLHEHTVFANAPFDLAVFGAKWPHMVPAIFDALDAGLIHDVQTREKLLDLGRGTFRFEEDEEGKVRAKGYSLFDLAMRRLGVKLDKDTWRMRYHELWDTPCRDWPAGARDYATGDAERTLQIFNLQEPQIQSNPDFFGNEAAQVRAHWALHLMSAWGFRTNQAAVDRLEKRVVEEIATMKDALIDAGLVRKVGSRDTKKAVRRMVDLLGEESVLTDGGLKLLKEGKTLKQVLDLAKDKGKFVSVAEEPCLMTGDETLRKYSRYSQLQNLLTGSVQHLARGTVTPVQTRYEPIMFTGRTSSSGPNIQNLRRVPGVRECFVPRPGNVLIACDYSQAELHTWAQVCYDLFGQSSMGDALNEGKDAHVMLGHKVAGISYEDAMELIEAGDDVMKNTHRRVAKHGNFAFMGGASAKRFVAMVYSLTQGRIILDMKEAARLRALWFQTWPEAKLYFDHVNECDDGNGFYYVKQVRVPRLRSNCTYTSACNSYFQGLASDGAKAALFEVARSQFTKGTPLWNSRSVAFVHDEILMEAPEDRAHEAAMELQRIMEEQFNRFVPDCPTQAEPTMMRYWSKQAKQVWDGDRLVPWDPDHDLGDIEVPASRAEEGAA